MTKLPLYCPACKATVELDSELHCQACDTTYPELSGVPFLFPYPQRELARWEARAHSEQQLLRKRQNECDKALAGPDPISSRSQATIDRLKHLSHAYGAQLDCISTLLKPLLRDRPGSDLTTYQALNTQGLQDSTTLFSYATNLFRDWVWGDKENDQALSMLQSVAPDLLASRGRTLVLGAGGGRLAWDLACASSSDVFAVDINPFTTLAAQQITQARPTGDSALTLWEFPLAPVATKDTALERNLCAHSNTTPANLQFVLADARALPFALNSFDLVITPWFTDVVQEAPKATARRINGLLKTDGQWLNFGSVAFANADPAQCLLLEELCDLVAANGYARPRVTEQQGPYLQSPHSRFSRVELLHAFAAKKERHLTKEAPDDKESSAPAWIADPRLAIPTLGRFQEQALATQVHAYLMSLIDGERSIEAIAQVLEERRLMTAREAVPVVQDFLKKMLEEHIL